MYYHYNSVFLLFSFFLKEPFFEKYKNFKIPHTRAIETLFYQAFLDNSITYKISIWISIWKIYRDEYNFKLLTSLLVTLLRISFSGHLLASQFPALYYFYPPVPRSYHHLSFACCCVRSTQASIRSSMSTTTWNTITYE